MLRFGFFAGFRSFTGRERLRYTLAIHEGRSNEPGKPPNPHAHLIWSDRGHDGIERTASTWFKRYNGKAPERGGARKKAKVIFVSRVWVRAVHYGSVVSSNPEETRRAG